MKQLDFVINIIWLNFKKDTKHPLQTNIIQLLKNKPFNVFFAIQILTNSKLCECSKNV